MTHTWTKTNKASGTSWSKSPKAGQKVVGNGTPIGLLLALTIPSTITVIQTVWNKTNKASGTAWTKITKTSGTAWTKTNKATGTVWNKTNKAT